jgi:hypothetical protein
MAYTTINKSTDYFNTKLYTGNATDDRSITGVGFQPDFSWVKRRDSAGSHRLKDSIRGATKTLISNSTSAESTEANVFQAFEADGFQLGSDSVLNASGATYASWNWLASNTTASNTDGSITSTVSANTTSGFSIVSYTGNATTGATIGHGLGVTPDVIIAKSRVAADNWGFFHSSFSSQEYMFLNTSAAKTSASSVWNALPDSSVFTVGDNESVNDNGNMIAYCFAEKTGYSKFGSYTGNGDNTGVFIYLGFKPAFIIIRSTASNTWLLLDNKRGPINVNQSKLYPDDNLAENTDTSNGMDFLSNGIKIRRNNSECNTSGQEYIYMAFAEAPLVGSNNVPTTAR